MNEDFFTKLGFYECNPQPMYRLDLPEDGTYILSTINGSLWIEYDEGHGEHYKQSVGFGTYTMNEIESLVRLLTISQ